MKIKSLTYFSIVATMLLLFSILNACGPKSQRAGIGNSFNENCERPRSDGGCDSGGTLGKGSEIGQVAAVFRDIEKLKIDTSIIFDNFMTQPNPNSAIIIYAAKENMRVELDKWCMQKMSDCGDFKSVAFLRDVKFDLHYDKPCLDGADEQQDASVDLKTKKHVICISLKSLSRFPPETLKKQIHAVLIHEYSHLLGEVESSNDIQEEILDQYDSLLTRDNLSADMKGLYVSLINQFLCRAQYLISYLKVNPSMNIYNDKTAQMIFFDINDVSFRIYETGKALQNSLKEKAKELNNENAQELNNLRNIHELVSEMNGMTEIILNSADISEHSTGNTSQSEVTSKTNFIKRFKPLDSQVIYNFTNLQNKVPSYYREEKSYDSCRKELDKRFRLDAKYSN
jgi:hypothetical protein